MQCIIVRERRSNVQELLILVTSLQYGFQPRNSTGLATVNLVGFISHEIETSNTPVNIYVDLSKAFETIHYDILLDK